MKLVRLFLTFLILGMLGACGSSDVAEPVFLVTDSAKADHTEPPIVMAPKTAPKKDKKKVAFDPPEETQKIDGPQTASESDATTMAREIHLATITTDYTDRAYDLILVIDENNLVTGIRTKSNKGRIKNYPLAVLDREVVLVKAIGVALVTLKCSNFDQSRGCPIQIEYPSNLTYGKFLRFEAQLQRRGDEWRLASHDRPFTSMHLIAKKMFGLLIGVERIELR